MIYRSLPALDSWPLQLHSLFEVVSWSQKAGDGISTLSLTCCVILGKLLSCNILVCKTVIITLSLQICSSDTVHLCYYCKLWVGGEISGERQRHRGPFHSHTGLASPEIPAHHLLRSLWNFSQKGDLAAEQGALCN